MIGQIEPHTVQMSESSIELLNVGLGQWRPQDRLDVGPQVGHVARSKQHHIRTRLMAHKTVGGISNALGTSVMHKEIERSVTI